jgi:uncharacterized membrane protein YkvA (DUF1232 family)
MRKALGSRRLPARLIDWRRGARHAWRVGLTSRSLPRFLFTGRAVRVLAYLPYFARLYWRLFRDRRVAVLAKAVLVLTIAYVVWPFDLVPDVVPFFGEVDDLAVVLFGLWLFVRLCPPQVVLERVREISTGAPSRD